MTPIIHSPRETAGRSFTEWAVARWDPYLTMGLRGFQFWSEGGHV